MPSAFKPSRIYTNLVEEGMQLLSLAPHFYTDYELLSTFHTSISRCIRMLASYSAAAMIVLLLLFSFHHSPSTFSKYN